MKTWRELIYLVLDEVKMLSDDSIFNENHVKTLLSLYRAYILQSQYLNIKKVIPQGNFQTICLKMELENNDFCGGVNMLVSTKEVPFLLPLGHVSIYPKAGFAYGKIIFVPLERFKYVGYNNALANQIYATIGPDKRLYVRSNNPGFMYMKNIFITGLFENAEAVAEIGSDCDCANADANIKCDYMDEAFPLEEAFQASLLQLVVKDLIGTTYRPMDNLNNANDDLGDISRYIANNMKKDYIRHQAPNETDGTELQ